MKKILLPCSLLIFFSCQKIMEKWQISTSHPNDTCQISQVTFERNLDGQLQKGIMNVSYNSYGNPERIEYVDDNYSPYFQGAGAFFTYDDNNRLIEFTIDSRSSVLYSYDGNAILPSRAKRFEYFHPQYNEELSFDANGRLASVEGKYDTSYWDNEDSPREYTVEYKYDARGNLLREGLEYDSSRSPLTTNKIWMLVQRNYSVNNANHAIAVNDQRLAVKFDFGQFIDYGDSTMTVTYECR
jgi:hypothetical protein